ncbi:SPW repeat domain-containing protein [Actinophytocola sp.]|uniref:SPW repeat domain-containing protein n=1 Tax=Actinophytocola sp. TaxID=1872138 RepID=UPI002D7F2CD3|nr:SPW repeat protein [Actinophytocola sp.]HET9142702.1 SPW repeat protein [Actinophytocola sp.]
MTASGSGDAGPAAAPGLWQQRVPGPQLPGLVTGITLMFGLWLILAPVWWTYGTTGGGFDARLSDVLAGVAVIALAIARLARPVRLITATLAAVLLGGWLVIAPFLLDYGFGADSTSATVNDVVVGVNLVGLALLGYLDAQSRLEAGGAPR